VEALRQHLASADAVVFGRVLTVHRAPEPLAAPISEHDPSWWVASARVIRSLKGDLKGEIEVRFPNSRDKAWYRVPKLKPDDEGIFLLHRGGPKLRASVLAIIHPEDFLPGDADEARRIANLI